jgi:hypothetical protein
MFAISTDGCHVVRTYNDAKYHYESIKPIRGSNNIRPYGPRNKQNMRIEEGTIDRVPYYAAVLYGTPCVRWFVDGRIQVRTGDYNTVSTAKFIHAVSPFTTQLFDNRVWVNSIPIADGDVGLTFQRDDITNTYVCLNLPELYTKHFNRAETKRLRDLPVVKTIQTYLKSMKALGVWDNRHTSPRHYYTQEKLHDILNAHIKSMTYEPPLEALAALGEHSHGPVEWDVLYAACLKLWLTDDDKLYERRDVPIGTMKKGVHCE